jgi:hypothetical protein
MKRPSTIFLQVVIVLIGIASICLLLWEPHLEGRNAHATAARIYLHDPFLLFAYIGSLPFFVALLQTFNLLGYARRNDVFSPKAVRALRTIKRCALCIIGFVLVGEIIILSHESDDRAGGVAMGVFISFGCMVVFTAAAVFERLLQSAVELKSENDLTV